MGDVIQMRACPVVVIAVVGSMVELEICYPDGSVHRGEFTAFQAAEIADDLRDAAADAMCRRSRL